MGFFPFPSFLPSSLWPEPTLLSSAQTVYGFTLWLSLLLLCYVFVATVALNLQYCFVFGTKSIHLLYTNTHREASSCEQHIFHFYSTIILY